MLTHPDSGTKSAVSAGFAPTFREREPRLVEIDESAFDIRATGRLNRLYIELLKENPDWDTAARREELNHFFARLIFCFFAEDTGIFIGARLFTDTVQQMSERDSSNTHEVLAELFRAMNTKQAERESANIRSRANSFPHVNGGLFSGSMDVSRFSRIARSYLYTQMTARQATSKKTGPKKPVQRKTKGADA